MTKQRVLTATPLLFLSLNRLHSKYITVLRIEKAGIETLLKREGGTMNMRSEQNKSLLQNTLNILLITCKYVFLSRVILVSLFLLITSVSLNGKEVGNKTPEEIRNSIISSLTDDEILIEGRLLTGPTNELKTAGFCHGKYKLNERNIICETNKGVIIEVKGTVSQSGPHTVAFNGIIKITQPSPIGLRDRVEKSTLSGVLLTNGMETVVSGVDSKRTEKIDGVVVHTSISRREFRVFVSWKETALGVSNGKESLSVTNQGSWIDKDKRPQSARERLRSLGFGR